MRSAKAAIAITALLTILPVSAHAADDPAIAVCEALLRADLHGAKHWRKGVSIEGSNVLIDYDTISAMYRPVPYVCRFTYDIGKKAFVVTAPPSVEYYKEPFSDNERTAIANKTGLHPIAQNKTALKRSN